MTIPGVWYEWLCHSNFSFGIGGSHPEEYVTRAAALGYGGLGLCDYDGVYGIVRAYRRQQELQHTIKLFYGAELHLGPDHHRPLVYRDSIVLYARNRRGYQELCSLLSSAHEHSKREACLPLDRLLAANPRDLICLQPMRGLIRHGTPVAIEERYRLLKEHFGDQFHLVLSRHLSPVEDRWINPTLAWSRSLDIPCIFSQDAYFHQPDSKDLCDILQAIRLNKPLDAIIPHLFVNGERCLQEPALLATRYRAFVDYERILQKSQALAEQIEFSLSELRYQYPQEFLPPGYSSQTFLEEIVWHMAYRCYEGLIPSNIRSLLERELLLVADLDFADYFLTVWDIVRWAREQEILCQGRGSAANSAICFVLGITSVNPANFDVLFERFISRERGDPPDIDVDFEHERREEVIQYIYARYGRPRAAMVANVISFRNRSAIRMVGKALGIAPHIIQEATRLQELRLDKHTDAIELPEEDSIPWALWDQLASRIKGFPRHMGIHSGGFVINQDPLDSICPQEPATMPGRSVLQWSKDDIEHLTIFKIDVLALGMLTVLRKTMHLVEQHQDRRLELATIPENDAATYEMIQRAATVGTFQVESRAQMSMLPRMRPRCFYDLVVQIGIIRPGPIQGGLVHPFLRRRQGKEAIVYPDPRLEPVLRRTLGVPIFQEQVMRIAMTVGSFTPGEADQLRKHIGAWSLNKDLGPLVGRLEAGMRRNGVEERFIRQILDHLKGFANYGFPESHAVSFARLAYASCYLKRHHQEAFYTSLLNSQPVGFYSIHALVHSARREGSHILPIDVRISGWDSSLEPWGNERWAIRLGLNLVRGLRREGVDQLLAVRKRLGGWTDGPHFLKTTQLQRGDLTALAAADALHGCGYDRRSSLWIAAAHPHAPLLEMDETPFDFGREDALQRVERDFDSFATTLGEHPTRIIRETNWPFALPKAMLSLAKQLAHLPDRRHVNVFGLVLVRQAPMTAKGMMFFTLEDETGFINLAFTPQQVERFSPFIQQQGLLCVSGRLQRQAEGHSILVDRVHTPQPMTPEVLPLRRTRSEEPQSPATLQLEQLHKARNFH